jgi:hypothetical protein
MGLFKPEKSLAEMEEEIEVTKTRRQLLEEKAAVQQLEAKMGSGSWKMFSSNGKKSGLDTSKIWNWLKTH